MKCPSCGIDNLPGEDSCDQCLHSLMQRDIPQLKKGETIQNIMMTAPISEIITGADLLVAKTSDSVQKVIEIFRQYDKDCVLVFKKKKFVGIVSQRDLLHRAAGKHKDLAKVTVESIMTPNPEYVSAEDPIAYVVNKMAVGGFRHVAVLAEDGTPITIMTIRDVLCYLDRRD